MSVEWEADKPLPTLDGTADDTGGLHWPQPNTSRRVVSRTKTASFDAQSFTPGLHASLVSEILSLRREVSARDDVIIHLESKLQTARSDHEIVNSRLLQTSKESRAAQQRVDDLQTNWNNATDQLVAERDGVLATNAELRTKCEDLLRQSRRDQEQQVAWHHDWERSKTAWDDERRQLEMKVNVTEARLRTLVDNISARQHDPEKHAGSDHVFTDSGFGNGSETGSIRSSKYHHRTRTMSNESTTSTRFSLSSPGKKKQLDAPGFSLADELDLTEEDESEPDELVDSDKAFPQFMSRLSTVFDPDADARMLLGLEDDDYMQSPVQLPTDETRRSDSHADRTVLQPRLSSFGFPLPMENRYKAAPCYQDAGTQSAVDVQPVHAADHLVSSGTQTVIDERPVYTSSSMQTDEPAHSADFERPPSLVVPSIAIHPPLSTPASPRVGKLPPIARDVACQTDFTSSIPMSDATVQTDDRQEDRGLLMHQCSPIVTVHEPLIDPDHVSDVQPSVVAGVTQRDPTSQTYLLDSDDECDDGNPFPVVKLGFTIPRSLKALSLPRPVLLAASPDLVASANQSQDMAPPNTESRSANFAARLHDLSSGLNKSHDHPLFSNAVPSNARAKTGIVSSVPTTVVEDKELQRLDNVSNTDGQYPSKQLALHSRRGPSSAPISTRSRGSSIDTLASSILSTSTQNPPFPIPARSSSRYPFEAFGYPESPTRNTESPRSNRTDGYRPGSRNVGLRKVHSAYAMRPHGRQSPRRRRRPNLAPILSIATDDPMLDDMLSPSSGFASQAFSTPITEQSSDMTKAIEKTEQLDQDASKDTALVDAIATTMVGEWMWKYAQPKKAFNKADGHDTSKTSGVRQKRWIWVSPYERTVMWSSKQPTSGPALLGRNGRKLVIKSILDVKDDNVMPKGESHFTVFDRSIIVLTQKRALKFTATSKERHYLWLMALSFLANPSQGPPKVPRVPGRSIKGSLDEDNTPQRRQATVIEQSKTKVQDQGHRFPTPTVREGQKKSRRASFTARALPSLRAVSDTGPKIEEPVMRPLEAQTTADSNLKTLLPSRGRHLRKRSNTGPTRMPSSLTDGLKSLTSGIRPSMTSPVISSRKSSFGATHTPTLQSPFSPIINGPYNDPTKHGELNPSFSMFSLDSPQASKTFGQGCGTVRMQAFVDPSYQDGVVYVPPLPLEEVVALRQRQNSQSTNNTLSSPLSPTFLAGPNTSYSAESQAAPFGTSFNSAFPAFDGGYVAPKEQKAPKSQSSWTSDLTTNEGISRWWTDQTPFPFGMPSKKCNNEEQKSRIKQKIDGVSSSLAGNSSEPSSVTCSGPKDSTTDDNLKSQATTGRRRVRERLEGFMNLSSARVRGNGRGEKKETSLGQQEQQQQRSRSDNLSHGPPKEGQGRERQDTSEGGRRVASDFAMSNRTFTNTTTTTTTITGAAGTKNTTTRRGYIVDEFGVDPFRGF